MVAAVVGVLVGLFAMHGLTGGHDTAMMSMSAPTHHATATMREGSAHPDGSTPVASSDTARHADGMGAACVAILTAGLLLLAAVLLRRVPPAEHETSGSPWRRPARARPPRLTTPSLSSLCIARI
jgi:zinc transporter ZupT